MLVAALSLDARSGGLTFVTGAIGALLVAALAVALVFARPGWMGALLGFFALLYVGHLLVAPESNLLTAAVIGIALLLVGELSQWSFDSRLHGRYEAGLHRARAIGLGGILLLGTGVLVVTLLALGLPVPAGLGTIVAGMAALVALVALISIVALRPGKR